MSPRLKPLILPQLVEERRKLELQQAADGEHTYIYYTHSSSSSDVASPSPVTPTFSRTHSRFSGSNSSLTSSCSESLSPTSPAQPQHANKNSKSQLPDVQEDPLEREDEDNTVMPYSVSDREFGLYDCLCDEPCTHGHDLIHSATMHPYMREEFDYDLGFMSENDLGASPRQKKRRHGSDGFSSWSTRLGSKLSSLPRWNAAARRNHFAFSPASDPALDQRPSFSRAASSRSSSISVPVRGDRHEPTLPTTPALSFYGSVESVLLPSPVDTTQVSAGKSLERERAMATTPLLPPLLTESALHHAHQQSLQPSPLQSPTVAPEGLSQTYPTPPLSTKASVSSFRRGTVSSTHSEIPSPIPYLLDQQDAWSDRLGHANFTIEPKPYSPEPADLATLQAFRADWDLARINYTKHLVRTGEHYGTTSKTYVLTEAKWAEIEQEWHRTEDNIIHRLDPQTSPLRRATEEMLPAAIPRMLSDEGKFPERGDVDIVGPMVRDAVMMRDGYDDRKNSTSWWLKSLAGRVGLRR
ncbi:hypothetical protein B0H67DRAFT_481015 [Lasiosphaeris hirsuta]|uniref:Only prolin and serin are matching in the corresponding protein n=1 Tax=Lasiosphaeris hirsuta TaxID=260670 RepID=A0AA40AYP3_9PEZI|nr:hypothetical protein B0H67DRAFT_481015 [Lasiosphaeris hirsuta]